MDIHNLGITDDLIIKSILGLFVFLVDMTGVTMPLFFPRWFLRKQKIQLINCITGGILLGNSMLQLLYEAESKQPSWEKMSERPFPLTHFVSGIGFITTLCLQWMIVLYEMKKADQNKNNPEMSIITTKDNQRHQNRTGGEYSEFIPERPRVSETKISFIFLLVLLLESLVTGMTMGIQNRIFGVTIVFFAIISHDWIEGMMLVLGFIDSVNRTFIISKKRILIFGFLFAFSTSVGIAMGILLNILISDIYLGFIAGNFMAFTSGSFLYIGSIELIAKEFHSEEDSVHIDDSVALYDRESTYPNKKKKMIKKIACVVSGFIFSSAVVLLLSYFE